LGTALIGAVLLAGLTTGFHDHVRADSAVPPQVQEQIVSETTDGLAMVSKSEAQATAEKAGLPPDQVDAVVDDYSDAQIKALKNALLVASLFVLVGLWFARALPNEPLAKEDEAGEPPDAGRHPIEMMREPAPEETIGATVSKEEA